MTDRKDNSTAGKGTKPAISTSSSLDKPLVDEKAVDKTAEIDTSHLTVDDSTTQAGSSLESNDELEAPAINTSHLSVEENLDEVQKPHDSDDDFDLSEDLAKDHTNADETVAANPATDSGPTESELNIENPLASERKPGAPANKTAAPTPDNNAVDEQLTMTTGLSDAEFDQELQNSDAEKSATNIGDEDDAASDSPIQSILDTVKKPEKIVRNAWSTSSARRFLLENVDSYREKDEDQNMEEVIEKVYGGATESKLSPKKFIKENLLFSFLVLIFLFLVGWKAAGIFFPDIMPAINDQIIETVQKQTSRTVKKKTVDKDKPIVTNQANKEIIENTLSHCLVAPDARMQFTSAFSIVGYEFSNRPLTLSYEETRDSIKVWENMNMDFYIKDAIFRFRVLAEITLPAIKDASNTVTDYSQSLMQLSKQANELETRIREIRTSKGNQSTSTINERIPLRNKHDEITSRLAEEPDQKRFLQILTKLSLAEKVLSGIEKPERIMPDQITENDPEWLISITETASSDIGIPIEQQVIPAIQVPVEKLKKVSSKLTAFHLSELESAVTSVLKLSSLLTYLPENQLIPYKLELQGLNRRLNKLMKKDLPQWINFNSCLTTKRAEVIATPE